MNLSLTLEQKLSPRQELKARLELQIKNEQTRNVVFLLHCGWRFCMDLHRRCSRRQTMARALSRQFVRRWWYVFNDFVKLRVKRSVAWQLIGRWVEPSETIGTTVHYRLRESIA